MLPTDTAMRDILTAPLAERPDRLRAMMEPASGMFCYFGPSPDLVAVHQMGSGFRVDREDPDALPALDRLRDADAWRRIEAAVREGLDRQLAATPEIAVPDRLVVLLVLGDSSDRHFMDVNLGMSANGAFSGYLWLNLWPSDENLARIEATTVHELNHNLRYTNVVWDVATVTVGEQIVSEGLADAFARELYGAELGYTRIGVAPQRDQQAIDKVMANLDVVGMQNLAPWVHGDATAARFGAAPVGVPTGIGYAVGNRMIDAYLATTGRTAAESLLVTRDEVISAALTRA